jgi:hypothetical protein
MIQFLLLFRRMLLSSHIPKQGWFCRILHLLMLSPSNVESSLKTANLPPLLGIMYRLIYTLILNLIFEVFHKTSHSNIYSVHVIETAGVSIR